MPWRQQRLAGAKAAWGVLWSSDQDLECSENSDPDVSLRRGYIHTNLDVDRTDPAVILLECWSTNTFRPFFTPISAPWICSSSSTSSFFCFRLSSREYSESLSTFLLLKAQQMPVSVGTGLNSLAQSTSLPCSTHLCRRCSDPGASPGDCLCRYLPLDILRAYLASCSTAGWSARGG